jgi:hypothetical protein
MVSHVKATTGRPSFRAAKTDDGVALLKGFAFFIYVVVALYVSNLAAFLILKPGDAAAISSLPEIARLGGKLCLLEAMSGLLFPWHQFAQVSSLENAVGKLC